MYALKNPVGDLALPSDRMLERVAEEWEAEFRLLANASGQGTELLVERFPWLLQVQAADVSVEELARRPHSFAASARHGLGCLQNNCRREIGAEKIEPHDLS